MSMEQAQAFVKGLEDLATQYKADAEARSEQYKATVEGQAKEFQDEAHDYAADMTTRADQLVTDVKALYDSIYPEGSPGGGETTPPDSGSGDQDNMWEGKPSDPHPSTGPAPIPTPKGKK